MITLKNKLRSHHLHFIQVLVRLIMLPCLMTIQNISEQMIIRFQRIIGYALNLLIIK